MKIRTVSLFSLVAGLFAANLFSATPLNPVPISDAIKTPIGEVRDGTVKVPIITWGGDIATDLANGNSLATVKGSIFDSQGLKVLIAREDVFTKQVEAYIRGDSPYIRGTVGQIGMALELLNKDPRTKPIAIYQHTWSTGGDCLVVKGNIKTAADLKGKTIALQAYGPHVDYLARILTDAGVGLSDVKVKWVKDITGSDESPDAAFRNADVDAAFVISPDASALTSNGTVGTGAEKSVKGARIMLSTKTARGIIADVYVVRQDYFNAHRQNVEKFVYSLLLAGEKLTKLMADGTSRKAEYDALLKGSAKILLDSDQATGDVKGLYGDCTYVGYAGNVEFFGGSAQRRLSVVNDEGQAGLLGLGLIHAKSEIAQAGFDYEALKSGLSQTALVSLPKFQTQEVQKVIGQKAEQGTLGNNSIFSFEIFFRPNQNSFNVDTYRPEFKKVIDLAAVYGGAIITVEGHSDVMNYLKKRKAGESSVVLGMVKQSAKNLSLARANAVRDSIIEFAKQSGLALDSSQFAVVGYGITNPKTGLIGGEPKEPATEAEWLSNMRVEFRLVSVEAEESVFAPAGGGK
ncbi:MAG: ABC transporter substrate-binding protein [Candidatus Paceibacterota bacterium]|jgi:ABC-type taurine transport system substrate-binding protein